MQGVAEAKQVVVAQAKADCEELLVRIVQDKRAADEQERQVRAPARVHASPGAHPAKLSARYAHAAALASHPCQLSWRAARSLRRPSFPLAAAGWPSHPPTLLCHPPSSAAHQVNAEATKIAKEAAEANAIKTQVQAELDKALPALQVGGQGALCESAPHNPCLASLRLAASPAHPIPAPPPRPRRRRSTC
jgi:hypothetical protein